MRVEWTLVSARRARAGVTRCLLLSAPSMSLTVPEVSSSGGRRPDTCARGPSLPSGRLRYRRTAVMVSVFRAGRRAGSPAKSRRKIGLQRPQPDTDGGPGLAPPPSTLSRTPPSRADGSSLAHASLTVRMLWFLNNIACSTLHSYKSISILHVTLYTQFIQIDIKYTRRVLYT